jgi:hypothetical protein
MNLENMNTVMIFENLDPERAIGTIAELLEKGKEVGSLGKHLYCLRNGKQVLLGHSGPNPVGPGGRITSTQQVLVNKQ